MKSSTSCPHCLGRREFLGTGLALGLGLLLPLRSTAAEALRDSSGPLLIDGARARRNTPIGAGSRLATGNDSRASFVIGDNAFLLRSNSEVQFTADRSGKLIEALRLLSGGLLTVFGPGRKKLHTSTATIGIRGTALYLESREASSYVCLCYGAIDLGADADTEGRNVPMQAEHHQAKQVGGDGQMQDAAMRDHHDDELVMLESLVGRVPPFLQKK